MAKGATTLRVGSWNIGILTGKSVELGKILEKRKINIACVHETRWEGDKVRDIDKFKLWYSGRVGGRNKLCILVDEDLRELVVEDRRVNDRLMTINLVVGSFTLNIISAYAPQAGLYEEVKRRFRKDLDEMVRGIPHTEKFFIGGDFNGHIGATSEGYDDVHSGFGFGDRNGGGTSLLDFARAFDLVIANSSFLNKREHLVTFRSLVPETQIDYLLYRKSDRSLYTDCKVILSENLSTLQRLLVMDLEIMRKRRKREMYNQYSIKWGALTEDKAQELGVKLLTMGVWRSSGNASAMWTTTAQYIREAAREVLGVSNVYSGSHKGDWWWNREVQGKVKTKKTVYLKLVESVDEEEKRVNREHYKLDKKETKLVVMAAKTATFS
ncbi:uncharacterized protein LOC107788923 [Nicotiana tabacum]|uniref:uncharacterized protein LOC107788923 n=1 Tax=Nicotiana tabacum TaxID=4097 RepID=UPI003F4EDBDB